MPRSSQDFKSNVFINCPFDDEYKPMFNAITFTVQITGFRPRSSLEASNAATNRLQKIMNIIGQCKYGIHDVSRTELNPRGLPRFNMPLELGIDLGGEQYGDFPLSTKTLLVLDRTPFRYQQFISDISGQDVKSHRNSIKQAVIVVRDWLAAESTLPSIPGGNYVYNRYRIFRSRLPILCETLKRTPDELTFGDFTQIVKIWLEENET